MKKEAPLKGFFLYADMILQTLGASADYSKEKRN
jgi:hypothetical protein